MKIYVYLLIPLPGFILGALYLLYSYYQGKNLSDNINHDAHLYGALFGIVFTSILRPAFLLEFIGQLSGFSLL